MTSPAREHGRGLHHARGAGRTALMRVLVAGVAALAASAGLAGEPPARSVVIIGQEDPILPWSIAVSTVARATLNADSDRRVVIYAEDLDFGRFGGDRYKRQLQNHLREKYMYVPVGALLALGPIAFDFVINARDSIWPGVPIVFGAIDEATIAKTKLPPGVTGRTLRFRLDDMIQSASAVVPDLKQVALVGDPFERSNYFRNFSAEIPELAKTLQFIDLTGLPLNEVRRRTAQLPAQTAIAYTAIYRDGDGYDFMPREALRSVADVANRPIVVPAETYIGYGTVGGIVATPVPIAEDVARLALRILDGAPPSDLPIALGNYVKPIFDWRELQRWGVRDARLPPGSEVLFRQLSFWEQYRGLALAGAGIIAVQATLITGLFLERRRRSAAELEARRRLAEVAHMNRRAGIAALSASIAHELNQPLGAILSNAEAAELLLDRQPLDVALVKEMLGDIRRSDQRAADVITHMRELLRRDDSEPLEIDMNDVVRHVIELLAPEARQRGIFVSTALESRRLSVRANSVHMQQVLLNLALNGMDAMRDVAPGNRRLTIQTALLDNATVEVAISDSGPGVPADILKRVFEPFFTTKPEGIGLGLSIAHTIIERAGGAISAENRPMGGAVFRFSLPAAIARPARAETGRQAAGPTAAGRPPLSRAAG
jgi:signal transduction histidine kinase